MLKLIQSPVNLLVSLTLVIQACQSHSSVKEVTKADKKEKTLFSLLSDERTNINFNNKLTEGLNTNVLMYEYFYNGGGVAIGDFNGDGLEDIYFTANMTSNRLYLNKGNMEFDDVTNAAGVSGRNGPWKTGVSMVDINGDGRQDLYVCYSGKLPGKKRRNELYINQGNDDKGIPQFEEMAAKYGLADSAYSTQAVFFDFDIDGDLDMFLLNHNPNSLPISDRATTSQILKSRDFAAGSKLFRNDRDNDGNMYFKDVTEQSGIKSTSLSYGLGVGIADIDKNGYPDIYVSNDYDVPDYLYMNNGDGTFTDQLKIRLRYTPRFSMGNDIADINNDGLHDILTLDMLPEDNERQKLLRSPDNYELFNLNVKVGFHYQYMRNMLQLDIGDGNFSEIAQLSGISNTDWSWAALLADYDNDGWKDLFITNGYLRDYTNLDFIKYMGDFIQNNEKIWRKDLLGLVHKMPASDLVNYIYKNNGDLTFTDKRASWGFTVPSNSNGAAYADLDNDGDLDLVVNNVNTRSFIYENNSIGYSSNHFIRIKSEGLPGNTLGIGARVTLFTNGKMQHREQTLTRGYQSSVSPIMHFGLGKESFIDSLEVIWPGGKKQVLYDLRANQTITLRQKEALKTEKPPGLAAPVFTECKSPANFQHAKNKINDFKRQPLMVNPQSFSGPCAIKGDVNGDNIDDLYLGGAANQAGILLIGKSDGKFLLKEAKAFEEDAMSEDIDAVFFDADKNGTLDLYVGSGGYHNFSPQDPRLQDRLYLNDGHGNFTRSSKALPKMLTSTGSAVTLDINMDGHQDLFVGGRVVPGRYPELPQSYLLVNGGNGNFEDQLSSISTLLQRVGMVTDAASVDINKDGIQDLIIVGEWMPIKVFINENGKLVDESDKYFKQEYFGWWSSLLVDDFNNDGNPDIIAGNLGLNTQFRANDHQPVELYYKDFDNNGSVDPILCSYIQGKSYPYVNRDELLEQLNMLRSRFTSYKAYANATINDIFTKPEMKGAEYLKANCLETSCFLGSDEGIFSRKTLPLQVQTSPVFTITPLDYNNDDKTDLLLCGNINQAGLKLGKLGASYGILLKATGGGNFAYVPQSLSGLRLSGDVRSVCKFNDLLLFGINQGSIKAYRLNTDKTIIN